VTPPTAELLPAATVALSAVVNDAGGSAIPAAAALSWTSGATGVATVDPASGVVTAVAEGTATITATSGAVSGEATITVLAPPPDLNFDADGMLGGTVNAGAVTVAAGVTLTLMEDLVLTTTGPVTIEGSIAGDCRAVDVMAGGTLTMTNASLDFGCSVSGDTDPTVRIRSAGELVLEGGEIRSGGDLVVGTVAPSSQGIASSQGPQFEDAVSTDCRMGSGTVLAPSDVAGPVPDGQNANDAGNLTIDCNGNLVVGFVQLYSGEGRDGGPDTNTGLEPAVAGDGGDGGDLTIKSAAQLTIRSGIMEVYVGKGGNGGDAVHTPSGNGKDAEAVAGNGGNAGRFTLEAPSLLIEEGGLLRIGFGPSGSGGDATAVGSDGTDEEDGGNARAIAGAAGDIYTDDVSFYGERSGIDMIVTNPLNDATEQAIVYRDAPAAGNGGEASATSGRGADYDAFGPGFDGGDAHAVGGRGGSIRIFNNGMPTPMMGLGSGGDAEIEGGRGGDGAATFCAAGGAGGAGGDASGSVGDRGGKHPLEMNVTEGTVGGLSYGEFGQGGNAGEGEPGGTAGPGGSFTEGSFEDPVPDPLGTSGLDAFEDGNPGATVPCESSTEVATTITVKSDLNGHNPFINVTLITAMVFRFQVSQLLLTLQEVGIIPGLVGSVTAPSGAPATVGPDGAVAAGTYGFSLSGMGPIAGQNDVVVTFIGTMEVDDQGTITAIAGELVVDANNNKLPPNGMGEFNSAIYDVTGAPASGAPRR